MNYTWKIGDSWHRVSWVNLGDETRYREILEANPLFSAVKLPNPGEEINIPISNNPSLRTPTSENSRYFPWPDPDTYFERMYNYSGLALFFSEEQNGPTLV